MVITSRFVSVYLGKVEKTHLDGGYAHHKNEKDRSYVPVSISPPGSVLFIQTHWV